MVQYRPLDPRKSEIRLVTLLPGRPRDAIRCTLSTASLDSPPNFTALSYVWGDTSKTKSINLEGEPFDVTVNLEAGLRTIRKRWRRRVLWIDAICINQKDVEEKNHQVPQMGRLYSTAPSVLAWLGPSNANIELFVSWARAHATRSHIAAWAYWLALDARSVLSKSAKRERDLTLVRAFEGYLDFEDLSYWRRVWTFQEYLLPRVAPVFLCGNLKPFQLATVFSNKDTLLKSQTQAWDRLNAEYRKMNEKDLATWSEVRRQRRLIKEISAMVFIVPSLPGLRTLIQQAKHIAIMLHATANRQCFDERDKVFGLYGIIPAAQDVYPPDYTKPITEVMLQTAAYMVNFERSSWNLWSIFGLRHDRLSNSRLYPSWMPDFSLTKLGPTLHVDRDRPLARPLRQPEDSPAPVSVEHTTLRLWARCLGKSNIAVQFADTESNVLEQINGLLQMDLLEGQMGKSVRNPDTLISRIARACVTHWTSSAFSTKEILETFHLVFDSGFDSLSSSQESCWDSTQTAAEKLTGKALLVTEDGCFGISVGGVRDGDIVVIPPEVEVPLVLTPDSSTSADGVQYYKMVGTAVIDGVMDEGELFDEELVEEIAKRDVVEFLVH